MVLPKLPTFHPFNSIRSIHPLHPSSYGCISLQHFLSCFRKSSVGVWMFFFVVCWRGENSGKVNPAMMVISLSFFFVFEKDKDFMWERTGMVVSSAERNSFGVTLKHLMISRGCRYVYVYVIILIALSAKTNPLLQDFSQLKCWGSSLFSESFLQCVKD